MDWADGYERVGLDACARILRRAAPLLKGIGHAGEDDPRWETLDALESSFYREDEASDARVAAFIQENLDALSRGLD